LDAFVKQKEKVTDYRTHVSGVRAMDLVGKDAMTFEEVQKKVAGILKDRFLVGHAVHNDLKALLLKHSSHLTRDTQTLPLIRAIYKTKRPGLRTVIKQEFNLDIQAGEHSSVTDARATMALYRVYKSRWDDSLRPVSLKRKRAASIVPDEDSDADSEVAADEPSFARSSSSLPAPQISRSLSPSTPPMTVASKKKKQKLTKQVPSFSSPPSRSPSPSPSLSIPSIIIHSQSSPATRKPSTPAPAKLPQTKVPKKAGGGGGRKGVSSGLSTVVRDQSGRRVMGRKGVVSTGGGGAGGGGSWWSALGS